MGALLNTADWSASPLGPPSGWPAALHTIVSLMLDVPQPAFVCWGPQLLLLYNDGYRSILGERHPAGLGQPIAAVWPEIWEAIEPLARRALNGEAVHLQHAPFMIRRHGRTEEAWFSFSYTPVRDVQGVVGGLYGTISETTGEVQAEIERRRETYRLRSLLHESPSVMAVFRGPEHVYDMVSPSYCDYFGVKDVLGKRLSEVMPGLQSQGFLALLDRVYQTGEPYVGRALPFEYIRSEDGTRTLCYFDLYYQPLRNSDGAVTGILAEGIDVTEAVQAAAALQASEQRLMLLDAIGEATRELSAPKDVMEATARLLGEHMKVSRCAYADVEDDNDTFTIHQDWSAPGHASSAGTYSLDLFGPRAQAAMRGGSILVIRDMDAELAPHEGADMFNAIGIKAIITCPLVKDGRLRAMMAVHAAEPRNWSAEDIRLVEAVVERCWAHIERVRAMEALRDREEHYARLFESSAAGVAETDLEGTFLGVNDRYCKLLGRTREQILGVRMQDFTHPDDLGRNLPLFRRAVEEGIPFEIEKRYLRPDGSIVWAHLSVSMVRRRGKQTILGTAVDITDRKRADERLHEEARRKDDFLAMLAHELRNPLAPIRAAAELLQLGQAAPLDQGRLLKTSEIITRQVSHMTELVDDLLDVSRVTRGLVVLNKAPQDMKAVVTHAVEQVRPIVEARRHQLAIRLDAAPTWVLGDDKRLVQVATNLVHNAAKYTPHGGQITLVLEVRADMVALVVSDNGIGIAPALRDKVFEPFAQAERTPDREQGGLGLGLPLVKSLVELHGGRVECFSEGTGCGSRFTVLLPLLARLPANHHAPSGPPPVESMARTLRVMVVDDNVDAAVMLATLLEAYGHEVLVEHRAQGALQRAPHEAPEVFFLDIGLPGMDGLELARRLRALPATAAATLVAVTGYGQEQDKVATAAAGFDHHLVKPVGAAQLVQVLSGIANRTRS